MNPALEQTAAHGGGGVIQHAAQGVFVCAGETEFELQIAAARGVEQQCVAAILQAERAQVRQAAALRVAHVGQQCARRRDAEDGVRATEAREIARAELRAQQTCRSVEIKMPRRNPAQPASSFDKWGVPEVLAHQQLCGPQPFQFARDGLRSFHF